MNIDGRLSGVTLCPYAFVDCEIAGARAKPAQLVDAASVV
jgi:hypothetical protein